jgi:hypothetical protein
MKLTTIITMLALSVGSTLAAPLAVTVTTTMTIYATSTATKTVTTTVQKEYCTMSMEDRKKMEKLAMEQYPEDCWGC